MEMKDQTPRGVLRCVSSPIAGSPAEQAPEEETDRGRDDYARARMLLDEFQRAVDDVAHGRFPHPLQLVDGLRADLAIEFLGLSQFRFRPAHRRLGRLNLGGTIGVWARAVGGPGG